ncbi:MAG TPA: quinol:electron acceptor oxidoreductase subunit ActD [Candidatus Dormibacteraeota bacterium]|nr:quinol:electron acceptor oxidoreductase subunit ActD [Candidatus Dormibacteraeota bacterium]
MSMADSIYGLFPDPAAADRGLRGLRAAGVPADKLLVMSPEPFEEYEFAHTDRKTPMPWIAALGGLVGGTCGYLLARYTQVAYPSHIISGGMPLVSKWPSGIITYELTMLGAILTTAITLLITAKLLRWNLDIYDPEISYGKILIGVVDPAVESRGDFEDRLRGAGAEKIKGTGRFSAT